MIWHRLRNDFNLAIITIFGAIAIIGIVPFAVYRHYAGNNIAAIMDTTIALAIAASMAHAWLTHNTKRASAVMVIVITMGSVASATVLGLAGLLWSFPALLVSFLLIDRKKAMALSLVSLTFLVWHGKAFQSGLEVAMFLVTAIVVCMFAFIFAYRTETQRQQLEALALLDPLTGAQNRRGMHRELDIAITTNARENTSYGLLIMDLDHFKQINDKYGHEEGDDVLILFSDLIRKNSRKMDRFFRMGGEEFVLLLYGVDMPEMQAIVEHNRKFIEQHLRCRDEIVTVSIGAAVLKSGESRQEWLARADAALYAAKRAGRNRTVVDDGSFN